MEAARLAIQQFSSVALDWTMVLGFFATQAWVATGGVQQLIAG